MTATAPKIAITDTELKLDKRLEKIQFQFLCTLLKKKLKEIKGMLLMSNA